MAQLSLARKFGLLLILLLVPLLVARCGSEGDPDSAESTKPAELNWVTYDSNSQVEKLLVGEYSTAHPNITFKREQNDYGHSYFEDTPLPDLMAFSVGNDYQQAIRNGQLADLSEVWNEAQLDGKLIPALDALVVNEAGGQRYLLPAAFSWGGFYYNKAIFDKYGLTPPQTWDEFLQICDTLYNNAERALSIPGSNSYSYTFWFDYLNLRLNGADYQRGLQAGQESYDDPRLYKVLETWRSLFQKGYFIESPQSVGDLDAVTALVRDDKGMLRGEKAAMVLTDRYSFSQAPDKFRQELGFFPFPVMDPAIASAEAVGLMGYVVPANADDGAAAQHFLAYLSSDKAQEMFAQEILIDGATLAPVRTGLDDDHMTADAQSAQELIQAASEVVPFTFSSMPNEMWSGFDLGYQRFLSNDYDPQLFIEALEKARLKAVKNGVFGQ